MCALWCSVKNIFTFGTRVAQDGSMTFNRPVWTTRDTQRMWNVSRASSFVFAVSVLEEQADETTMETMQHMAGPPEHSHDV